MSLHAHWIQVCFQKSKSNSFSLFLSDFRRLMMSELCFLFASCPPVIQVDRSASIDKMFLVSLWQLFLCQCFLSITWRSHDRCDSWCESWNNHIRLDHNIIWVFVRNSSRLSFASNWFSAQFRRLPQMVKIRLIGLTQGKLSLLDMSN